MPVVTSVNLKAHFKKFLGLTTDVPLDVGLICLKDGLSFKLSLKEADLASLTGASPSFTLKARELCVLLMHGANARAVEALCKSDRDVKRLSELLSDLPETVQELLFNAGRNNAKAPHAAEPNFKDDPCQNQHLPPLFSSLPADATVPQSARCGNNSSLTAGVTSSQTPGTASGSPAPLSPAPSLSTPPSTASASPQALSTLPSSVSGTVKPPPSTPEAHQPPSENLPWILPALPSPLSSGTAAMNTALTLTDRLVAIAVIEIRGSFLEGLFKIGYPGTGADTYADPAAGAGTARDRLELVALLNKGISLKEALFVASLPNFELFNRVALRDVALSFSLSSAQKQDKSHRETPSVNAQAPSPYFNSRCTLTASAQQNGVAAQGASVATSLFAYTDFVTLLAGLNAAFRDQVTRSFYLQGRVDLKVAGLNLIFKGRLTVNNCYCAGEVELIGKDGQSAPHASFTFWEAGPEFFALRLVALRVYGKESTSAPENRQQGLEKARTPTTSSPFPASASAFSALAVASTAQAGATTAFSFPTGTRLILNAAVNVAGVKLKAALIYEDEVIHEAGILLEARMSLSETFYSLAKIRLGGFELALGEGSYLRYRREKETKGSQSAAGYSLSAGLNLRLKVLSFDISGALSLSFTTKAGSTDVYGALQLTEPLSLLTIVTLRGISAEGTQALGPLLYISSGNERKLDVSGRRKRSLNDSGALQTLAGERAVTVGFRGELVILQDLIVPFDLGIKRDESRSEESLTGHFSITHPSFSGGKLSFYLSYSVSTAQGKHHPGRFTLFMDTPLKLPELNVLGELCKSVDSLPTGRGCASLRALLKEHGDKGTLAHRITPHFDFSKEKQLTLYVSVLLGAGNLEDEDNVFYKKARLDLLSFDLNKELSFTGLIDEAVRQFPERLGEIFKELFSSGDGDIVRLYGFLSYLFPGLVGRIAEILLCRSADPSLAEKVARHKKSSPGRGRSKARAMSGGEGGKSGFSLSDILNSLMGAFTGGSTFYGDVGLYAGSLLAASAFIGFYSERTASAEEQSPYGEERAHEEIAERLLPCYQRGFIPQEGMITLADGTVCAVERIKPGAEVLGRDLKAYRVLSVVRTPLADEPLVCITFPAQYGLAPVIVSVYTALRTVAGERCPLEIKDGPTLPPTALRAADGGLLKEISPEDELYLYDASAWKVLSLSARSLIFKAVSAPVSYTFYYALILEDAAADYFVNGIAVAQDLWQRQSFSCARLNVPPLRSPVSLALLEPRFTLDKLTLSWLCDLCPYSVSLDVKFYDCDFRRLSEAEAAAHELQDYAVNYSALTDADQPLELEIPKVASDLYCRVAFSRFLTSGHGGETLRSRFGLAVLRIAGLQFASPPVYAAASGALSFALLSASRRAYANVFLKDAPVAQNLEVNCGEPLTYVFPAKLRAEISEDTSLIIEARVRDEESSAAFTVTLEDGTLRDELLYSVTYVAYARVSYVREPEPVPEPAPEPEPSPVPESVDPADCLPLPEGASLSTSRSLFNNFKLGDREVRELRFFLYSADPVVRGLHAKYVTALIKRCDHVLDRPYVQVHAPAALPYLGILEGERRLCVIAWTLMSLGLSSEGLLDSMRGLERKMITFKATPEALTAACSLLVSYRDCLKAGAPLMACENLVSAHERKLSVALLPAVAALIHVDLGVASEYFHALWQIYGSSLIQGRLVPWLISLRSLTLLSWRTLLTLIKEMDFIAGAELTLDVTDAPLGLYGDVERMLHECISFAALSKSDAGFMLDTLRGQSLVPLTLSQCGSCLLLHGYHFEDLITAVSSRGLSPLSAAQWVSRMREELYRQLSCAIKAFKVRGYSGEECLECLEAMSGHLSLKELCALLVESGYTVQEVTPGLVSRGLSPMQAASLIEGLHLIQ